MADMKTGSTTLGEDTELESIAGAVIGRNSLVGGVGSIMGAGLGSLLLSVIRSGLIMAGPPRTGLSPSSGSFLIGAVTFNSKMREQLSRIIERSKIER